MTAIQNRVRLAIVVVACCLAVGLCAVALPHQAWAIAGKDGAKVTTLKNGKTCTVPDVTGDKKADKVKVQVTWTNKYGSKYISKVAIKVNGKTALSKSNTGFAGLSAFVVTLKNGKSFLFVKPTVMSDTPVWSKVKDSASFNGLYKYSGGKFKLVANTSKVFPSKVGTYRGVSLTEVSGNKVTLTYSAMTYFLSQLYADYSYAYKSGTLKQVSKKAPVRPMYGNKLVAAKSMTAYKNYDCKKKAFTIKKGKTVLFKQIFSNGKTVSLQVQSGSQLGWIKVAMSPKSSLLLKAGYGHVPPFENVYMAG